ncbi:protein-disulfide reductase DsbD domain-containing protein [Marinobacter sp.]|uniref:protein-disulfide reductase DsbD domain-containing protein n=1 Tax=Marinobacter sp. TaxID=50741 RepID=UPI00384FDEEA
MTRTTTWSLAATALLVIALAAFGAKSYFQSDSPVPRNEAPASLSGAAGPADSADKVRVNLAYEGEGPEQAMVIELDIDEGWHVNSTPASLEFLISTTVSARSGDRIVEIPTSYPQGKKSDVSLNGTMIELYDDGAQIRLEPDEGTIKAMEDGETLDLSVRVQSCSDSGICLAPSDIQIAVPLK